MRLLAVFLLTTIASTFSQAEKSPFALKKGLRWLVAASVSDVDKAIGIAQHYTSGRVQVVETTAGEFDVVVGPIRAETVSQLLKKNPDFPPLPHDARLSRGDDFKQTIWKPADDLSKVGLANFRELRIGDRLGVTMDNLKIRGRLQKVAGGSVLSLAGKVRGREVFNFTIGAGNEFGLAPMQIADVQLNSASKYPQIIITQSTGGTHCCIQTWIVTESNGGWQLLDLGRREAEGFAIEDVDGDGIAELIGLDDRFLYSFDVYADSYAPVQYFKFMSGKLVDVSTTKAFRSELLRDLAYIEYDAKMDPERWKSNGFLAAWVASKIRLGQGEDAWIVMLENYNKTNDFGLVECSFPKQDGKCPEDQQTKSEFPKALAEFLQQAKYGPLPLTALSSVQ